MYTLERSADDQITLRLSGKLGAEDMRALLDELVARSEGMNKGKLLYVVDDLQLPSLAALAVEMSRLPQLFGLLPRFSRCAVVAGQDWVRKTAEVEGKILPGIDITSYEAHEESVAQTWLDAPTA